MHVTENWRLKDQRYELKGARNGETQEVNFPPRAVASRAVETYTFDDSAQKERTAVEIRALAS